MKLIYKTETDSKKAKKLCGYIFWHIFFQERVSLWFYSDSQKGAYDPQKVKHSHHWYYTASQSSLQPDLLSWLQALTSKSKRGVYLRSHQNLHTPAVGPAVHHPDPSSAGKGLWSQPHRCHQQRFSLISHFCMLLHLRRSTLPKMTQPWAWPTSKDTDEKLRPGPLSPT